MFGASIDVFEMILRMIVIIFYVTALKKNFFFLLWLYTVYINVICGAVS